MLAYWFLTNCCRCNAREHRNQVRLVDVPNLKRNLADDSWIMWCCYCVAYLQLIFTFMVILTILCFVIQLCCSRSCKDDFNLNPLHRWCQFESISSHGIKRKFCMMILWCFPMFSRTLQSVPFEHYYKWPSILLLPCTWQPDTSSLAGPFPSRSQDLGAKRHTATIGDGMARSFIHLMDTSAKWMEVWGIQVDL